MDQFWVTDERFAKIASHLPTNTRGKARGDVRRTFSCITHVLKCGGRWTDAPREVHGPKKTHCNRFLRRAAKGIRVDLSETLAQAGGPPSQVLVDSNAVKTHRCAAAGKGGEQSQVIGCSWGRRTTKIHALADRTWRPLNFLPTNRGEWGRARHSAQGQSALEAVLLARAQPAGATPSSAFSAAS